METPDNFANYRVGPRQFKRRPSRISTPAHANPLAKLLFSEMRRQNVTYFELELRSGVLTSTFKAWRVHSTPGLTSIEAALGALGWTLVPVPKLETLPEQVRVHLSKIGEYFASDEQALGAAISAAAAWPAYAKELQPKVLKMANAA